MFLILILLIAIYCVTGIVNGDVTRLQGWDDDGKQVATGLQRAICKLISRAQSRSSYVSPCRSIAIGLFNIRPPRDYQT